MADPLPFFSEMFILKSLSAPFCTKIVQSPEVL
jgi:hypothetical protein